MESKPYLPHVPLSYPYYIVAFVVTYKRLKYLINPFFDQSFSGSVFRGLFINMRELLPSLLITATCVSNVLHNLCFFLTQFFSDRKSLVLMIPSF